MHKQITTVITAVATVCLLSSCTATGLFGQAGPLPETGPKEEAPAPSAPYSGSESAQEDVPAFHFASGDLVLGDFDPTSVKNNMFNPCEEISAEEFALLGFKTIQHHAVPPGGGAGCGLTGRDTHRGYAIVMTTVTRSLVEDAPNVLISDSASEAIPGLITYRGQGEGGLACVAAVDTVRGQLSIVVDEGTQPIGLDELCLSAVQIIEELYQNERN
ncbi:DUF3558 family protein [Corynebacterium tuscaniense]|uniref:DUF3558 family protein n=1 Tax=Corynebacterium tuscaniense TaxID=302449 RepID=UPI000A05DD29|nr:DUF3558 family protein [Corynebacterium tuscaniense]